MSHQCAIVELFISQYAWIFAEIKEDRQDKTEQEHGAEKELEMVLRHGYVEQRSTLEASTLMDSTGTFDSSFQSRSLQAFDSPQSVTQVSLATSRQRPQPQPQLCSVDAFVVSERMASTQPRGASITNLTVGSKPLCVSQLTIPVANVSREQVQAAPTTACHTADGTEQRLQEAWRRALWVVEEFDRLATEAITMVPCQTQATKSQCTPASRTGEQLGMGLAAETGAVWKISPAPPPIPLSSPPDFTPVPLDRLQITGEEESSSQCVSKRTLSLGEDCVNVASPATTVISTMPLFTKNGAKASFLHDYPLPSTLKRCRSHERLPESAADDADILSVEVQYELLRQECGSGPELTHHGLPSDGLSSNVIWMPPPPAYSNAMRPAGGVTNGGIMATAENQVSVAKSLI